MAAAKCPSCGGKISRGATLCAVCRRIAIHAGVNLIAAGPQGRAASPIAGPRTAGQNRGYHGKCGDLARLRGVKPQDVKRDVLQKASQMFGREITSSRDLDEDEMSEILDTLDDELAAAGVPE